MKNARTILPIFITVFIDLFGLGIVIPVIAPIVLDTSLNIVPAYYTLETRSIIIGLILAAYPFIQLFSAPMLGAYSDKYGRKIMLTLSLIGTMLGYILIALGITYENLPIIFIGRIIDGITGGNISIAYSAIADISDKSSKTKNFGILGMAFGLGFVLGPFIGGKLSDPKISSWFYYTTPFWFAAILSFINIGVLQLFFTETLKKVVETSVNAFTGIKNLSKAFTTPGLRTLFFINFLFLLGFNFFTQFFQVYAIDTFNFTQSDIGDIFAYIGLWIAITQGGILRPLAKRFSPEQIFKFSIISLALTFPFLLIINDWRYLYLIFPFVAIFNGLTQPNITTLISNHASDDSQGEILGINQSVTSLAQTIPPIIAGISISVSILMPTILASFFVACSWLVYIFYYDEKSRKKFDVE